MSQIVHINSDLRQRPFKSYHRPLGGDEADLPPRAVPHPMLVPAPVLLPPSWVH